MRKTEETIKDKKIALSEKQRKRERRKDVRI